MENLKTMLQGKKGLIVGIANDNSIAYGCARVLRDLGAEFAVTYLNEKADRGIFLQIVLKGLGGIVGNKTEMFLDKGIQGYRQREDQAM